MVPNGWVQLPAGRGMRTRALLHPQLPPSRGSPPETLHPFFPIARALSVSLDTAQLPSSSQRAPPFPQVPPALGSFELSKPAKSGAPLEPRSSWLSCSQK